LTQEKAGGKTKQRRKWEVKEMVVRFVPFKSEAQRNEAYRLWVKSLLRGLKKRKEVFGSVCTKVEEG